MTTPLTETQVAERHQQLAQEVHAIRQNLLDARDTFQPHTEHWSSCNGADSMLAQLLHRLEIAGRTLVRYNDPKFYTDVLQPTLASEDGGQYAAQQLWQVYPE